MQGGGVSQPSYNTWECPPPDMGPCAQCRVFRVDEWTDGYLTAFANVHLGCDVKGEDDLIPAYLRFRLTINPPVRPQWPRGDYGDFI